MPDRLISYKKVGNSSARLSWASYLKSELSDRPCVNKGIASSLSLFGCIKGVSNKRIL